jgi:hypothetical protein
MLGRLLLRMSGQAFYNGLQFQSLVASLIVFRCARIHTLALFLFLSLSLSFSKYMYV